jgi:hypothetical protein
MSQNPSHAAALAYLVHAIRPDWDRPGIERVITRIEADLAATAHAAIVAAVTRKDQKTPAVIAMAGSHWGTCTGEKPAVTQPAWRDPFADATPADPDTIRAIRARKDAS